MTPALRPGDRLGVFRLVEILGRGGQGQVYRAFDTERGLSVALKVLSGTDEDLARIRKEFRALEGIAHRNIVPFFELGQHGATTYFTMKFVEGRPLLDNPVPTTIPVPDSAFHSERAMSETVEPAAVEPSRWLIALVDALERIHALGLLHLDVKPSNLLIDVSGDPILVDFGLATRFDATTNLGRAPDQVSSGYSAPEHIRQESVSPASDWFGVGATLFTVLVGRPPTRDLRDEIEEVVRVGPLGQLCGDLLAPDPRSRPEASAIRRALRAKEAQDRTESVRPGATPTVETDPSDSIATRLDRLEASERSHRVGIFHVDSPAESTDAVPRSSGSGSPELILRARARQWEDVPFGVLRDLIGNSSLRARVGPGSTPSLAVVLRESPSADMNANRLHLRSAARELIDIISKSSLELRPCVFIEEFQWCDIDSLVVLLDALAIASDHFVDLILTHRGSGAPSPPLTRLRRWLVSAPPDLVRREFEPEPGVETPGRPAPKLPTRATEREYLELCAVAGTRVSQHEIRMALTRSDCELETLWALRSQGWLISSGPRLSDDVECTPSNLERVRSAISAGRTQRLHLLLARSARRSPYGLPSSIAHHSARAGFPNLAFEHLVTAARSARDGWAFERAAEHYLAALNSTSVPESRRTPLLPETAHVLRQCGRGREAADTWRAAAERSLGPNAQSWRVSAAEMYLTSGHYAEGRALLRDLSRNFGVRYPKTQLEALRRAGVGLLREVVLAQRRRPSRRSDPEALERAKYCSAAFQGLMPIDPSRAAVFATEGVRWSRKSGNDGAFASALTSLASGVLSPAGNRMRAWGGRMIDTAHRLAETQGNVELRARIEIARSTMAFWEGEWASACARVDSASRLLGSTHVERAFDRNVLNLVRTRSLEERGHWPAATIATSEMHADAVERGDTYAIVTACLNLGMLAIARGDLDAARSWADQATSMWPGKGMQVQHLYALRVHAYADLCEGNEGKAWRRLDTSWEAIRKGMHLRVSAGRVDIFALRGRIAAVHLHANPSSSRWNQELETSTEVLRRIERRDAQAHAALLRASKLSALHGSDDGRTRPAIEIAADRFREVDMRALADACDYVVADGPDTKLLRRRALVKGGIGDPDLWTRGFIPLGL